MYEFVFLRHGESEGVRNRTLQGRLDLPLTDHGRNQIRLLASYWLSGSQLFNKIITSPLRRARETGEIISGCLHIMDISEDKIWQERNFGKGEGKDLQLISDWYKSKPMPSPYEPIFETGESEWEVHLRAGKALEKLMALPTGCYLIVSHGNVLNAVMHVIFGMLPSAGYNPVEMSLAPGGYAKFTCNPASGGWKLISFNDPFYLSVPASGTN
jgi:broad specificity phosphatase PhoE